MSEPIRAIRCDHDGLKMAEVKDGHLILRTKHHGETHVKVVALGELVREERIRAEGRTTTDKVTRRPH